METDRGDKSKSGRTRANIPVCIVLVAIAVASAAVRLPKLGARDFWFDESCTFIYVHNLFNWPADSDLLVESTNLPYYLLLRGWTGVFGDSEAAYRSLSAFAAIPTVPLLAWFAWRLGGAWAGIACGLLAAVHPLHVYYAREARAYTLWVLALSATMVLLYQASRRGRLIGWAAFGAALLFCLHLHYFTVYWALASIAAVALAPSPKAALRQWAVTVGVVALLFAPYFVAAVLPAAAGGGNKWIARQFDAVSAIPQTLWAFLPAGAYPGHLRGLSLDSPDTLVRQPVWLGAAAQIVPGMMLLLLLLGRRFQRGRIEPRHQGSQEGEVSGSELAQAAKLNIDWRLHVFLLGMSVGPLLLAWLYSVLVRPNYLVARYDLVAWPAFMVWLGVVIAEAPKRLFRVAFLALLIACSAVPLHRLLASQPPPSLHRLRAERLAELAGAGDMVIAFSYDRDYLQYYLYRAGFEGTIRSFPTWLERQVGWLDTEADLPRLAEAGKDAAALGQEIQQRLAAGADVFLLSDSVDPQGAGPRAALNGLLLEALREAGLAVEPADTPYLIFKARGL